MTTSSSSQKKKTQVVADLIPNNYEEQPGLIEGKTKVFKDKVAARVDDLDNLGKFVTLFQYVLILVVILVLVLSRIFKGKREEGTTRSSRTSCEEVYGRKSKRN